jgi:hypothetical protein
MDAQFRASSCFLRHFEAKIDTTTKITNSKEVILAPAPARPLTLLRGMPGTPQKKRFALGTMALAHQASACATSLWVAVHCNPMSSP